MTGRSWIVGTLEGCSRGEGGQPEKSQYSLVLSDRQFSLRQFAFLSHFRLCPLLSRRREGGKRNTYLLLCAGHSTCLPPSSSRWLGEGGFSSSFWDQEHFSDSSREGQERLEERGMERGEEDGERTTCGSCQRRESRRKSERAAERANDPEFRTRFTPNFGLLKRLSLNSPSLPKDKSSKRSSVVTSPLSGSFISQRRLTLYQRRGSMATVGGPHQAGPTSPTMAYWSLWIKVTQQAASARGHLHPPLCSWLQETNLPQRGVLPAPGRHSLLLELNYSELQSPYNRTYFLFPNSLLCLNSSLMTYPNLA